MLALITFVSLDILQGGGSNVKSLLYVSSSNTVATTSSATSLEDKNNNHANTRSGQPSSETDLTTSRSMHQPSSTRAVTTAIPFIPNSPTEKHNEENDKDTSTTSTTKTATSTAATTTMVFTEFDDSYYLDKSKLLLQTKTKQATESQPFDEQQQKRRRTRRNSSNRPIPRSNGGSSTTTSSSSSTTMTRNDEKSFSSTSVPNHDLHHHYLPQWSSFFSRMRSQEQASASSYSQKRMLEHLHGRRLLSTSNEDDEDDESEDEDDESEDEDDEEETTGSSKRESHKLGPCVHEYPSRQEPEEGWTKDIDWFHFRQQHLEREACYLFCIDQLPEYYWKTILATSPSTQSMLLSEAVVTGLPAVVDKLVQEFQMDPLQVVGGTGYDDTIIDPELQGSNAVQQAIRMGNAQMVSLLTNHNPQTVIDTQGRTVEDYVRKKGSPIRPHDAKQYLHLDTTRDQYSKGIVEMCVYQPTTERQSFESMLSNHPGQGWNEDTAWGISEQCYMDIVYGSMSRAQFYNDYYLPGRPFVLRGIIPMDEIRAFAKSRWATLKKYRPTSKFWVGPTAYPNLTGQDSCEKKMTIAKIEAGEQCPDLPPDTPILHAWHPSNQDFVELFPSYDEGDIYRFKKSGWRKLGEWFYPDVNQYDEDIGWQIFFGGDESGATLHWHNAAFNVLYVGLKEWKVTPPWYRGFTGMTSKKARDKIDGSIALSCTQKPGDFVYIPNYWGHMTLNHGFTIGAATIMTNAYQSFANAKPRIHFVHINKTGGSSILDMLTSRCEPQYISESWEEDDVEGLSQRTFHATAHALIEHNGRDAWDNAFTFTVVRHPLARAVSNFFFLLDRCSNGSLSKKKCQERSIPYDPIDIAALNKNDETKIEAFHKHVHTLYTRYPPGSEHQYLFGSLGHGNERFRNSTFNATQTSWLVDEDGKIAVKHIFHLETLSEDMTELAKDLPCLLNNVDEDDNNSKEDDGDDSEDDGYTRRRRRRTRGRRGLLEMVHENATPKYPDYRLFGKNEKTNAIFQEVYGVDYVNFGYEATALLE